MQDQMKDIKKVLIVEDEILSAIWMTDFLTEEGYHVCTPVTTGEQALDAVKDDMPDIVFMDIHLAGAMDGIEVAKIIHDSYNIPIIFMTGYSNSDVLEKMKGLTPVACLDKPIQISDVEMSLSVAKNR
jgi:CheY-like chemotaxis protein